MRQVLAGMFWGRLLCLLLLLGAGFAQAESEKTGGVIRILGEAHSSELPVVEPSNIRSRLRSKSLESYRYPARNSKSPEGAKKRGSKKRQKEAVLALASDAVTNLMVGGTVAKAVTLNAAEGALTITLPVSENTTPSTPAELGDKADDSVGNENDKAPNDSASLTTEPVKDASANDTQDEDSSTSQSVDAAVVSDIQSPSPDPEEQGDEADTQVDNAKAPDDDVSLASEPEPVKDAAKNVTQGVDKSTSQAVDAAVASGVQNRSSPDKAPGSSEDDSVLLPETSSVAVANATGADVNDAAAQVDVSKMSGDIIFEYEHDGRILRSAWYPGAEDPEKMFYDPVLLKFKGDADQYMSTVLSYKDAPALDGYVRTIFLDVYVSSTQRERGDIHDDEKRLSLQLSEKKPDDLEAEEKTAQTLSAMDTEIANDVKSSRYASALENFYILLDENEFLKVAEIFLGKSLGAGLVQGKVDSEDNDASFKQYQEKFIEVMTRYGVPNLARYLHHGNFDLQLKEVVQPDAMKYWTMFDELSVVNVKSSYALGTSGVREIQGKDSFLPMIGVQPANQISAYPRLRTEADSVKEAAGGVYVVVDFAALENKVKSLISRQDDGTGDDESEMESEALIMPDSSDSIIRFVSRNAEQQPLILGENGWEAVSIHSPLPVSPALGDAPIPSMPDAAPPTDNNPPTVLANHELSSSDANGGTGNRPEDEPVNPSVLLTHAEGQEGQPTSGGDSEFEE